MYQFENFLGRDNAYWINIDGKYYLFVWELVSTKCQFYLFDRDGEIVADFSIACNIKNQRR